MTLNFAISQTFKHSAISVPLTYSLLIHFNTEGFEENIRFRLTKSYNDLGLELKLFLILSRQRLYHLRYSKVGGSKFSWIRAEVWLDKTI